MAWKRTLRWIGTLLVAGIAGLALAGYLVLRSPRFPSYVLAQIEKQASQSTGAQVHVQSFAFQPSTLTAEAFGITIRGNEPASVRPLVQADELRIRLKIVSLLRKKVDLSEIILLHPVVSLQVKRDGSTNLPTPPRSNGNTPTNPFDLGIQHVLLEHGEIYYNDVKTPLDAELHELQLEVKAELAANGYDGNLSYRNGRVLYGEMKPVPHDLTASFNATASEFMVKPLVLTVASSRVELTGCVRNYSHPSADGSYKITVHPQDARHALKDADLPAGAVTLTGSVRYQQQENVPVLRAVAINGRLNGELALNTSDLNAVVRNIRGEFELLNGNLDVHGVQADLLGGYVTAAATMQHLDANSTAKLHASVRSISLAAANAALRTARLDPMPMGGQINGTADAAWTGGVKNIKARSEIALKAALSGASGGSTPIPVDGAVNLSYDGHSGTATLTNTSVHTPQTRVEVDGTAGPTVHLNLRAHAADLKELDSLAAALRPVAANRPQSTASLRSMNLAGTADLQLLVEGTATDPHLRGQLAARGVQVKNTQWRSLELRLQASKSHISVQNGALVNGRQGHINFAVDSGLANWHYLPSSPITLEVSSRDLAVAELLQLATLDYPVSGNLSLDLSMHGSQLNPVGSGSVRLVQGNLYGQSVQQLSMQSQGNGEMLTSSLNMASSAGNAKGNLVLYPRRKGYELQLDVPGMKLAALHAVQEKNLDVTGVLTMTASGRGTLDDPQLDVAALVPELKVRDASISGVKADLHVANHEARLSLDSQVAQSSVQARGTMSLNDGHYTKATLDTKAIPIEGLLAWYAPAKSNAPRGVLEIHASAEGPLDDKDRMQAQVTIPTLKADYQGLQIGNTHPIQIHYANSVVALDPAEIAGTDTHIQLQGQLPVHGGARVGLSAVGTVDMQLLRFFQRDLQSSGQVQLDVRATGSPADPSVQGQLHVQNVSIVPADAPVGLQNLNGVLDVRNDQITITGLTGESGGGQISAQGVIGYRPQLQMNVAVQARKVRVRYQDAIRTILDGDLNLVGTTQAAHLNGRILVDSLSFTENFDLAALAGQIESGPESAPSQGMANNVKLNIAVQTARDLNLTSTAVSLQGQANLHVIGTAADPVIVGRTEFTAGDIFLMNKRYQIERGVIEFSNPNRTEPVLNVLLTTTINQYNISLAFRGPLDKMHTSYVSDPALPTADIINLIARGQTTEQAATSPSNFGASSLLAQGAASQVGSQVQRLAGLSSLSIDPTLGGNDSDPGARIALQKRVTNNFLFTFATNVTSTQRELIQGEYQFNRRWSASVTRDENGGFAVDGKYRKRF
jgi:translocation and assembly module TamB